jgi:secreted Zn-dependent insulinase-like peptidase
MEREALAVDSEFLKSTDDDCWHFSNLKNIISDPDSYANNFGCGNLQACSKPGMRKELFEFYEKWYSSNLLNLVICGNHDIHTLEKWANTFFSPIANKNVVLPDLSQPHPYSGNYVNKLLKWIPIKEKNTLTMQWILPQLCRHS